MVNGDNLIKQLTNITLLFTDKELKKHFTPESIKILRKCADRIEKAFEREKE